MKVLHKHLDKALQLKISKYPIAFIGISNWKLDLSKMNRMVFIARPDFDKECLVKTGRALLNTCNVEM